MAEHQRIPHLYNRMSADDYQYVIDAIKTVA